MDAIETSKTHRVYLLLKERITSGALQPGSRLPSEPSLAAAHGLSRVTIRRALDGLAREALITRRPGSGTFVNGFSSESPVVADLSNMLAHLVAMGRATRVKLLSFAYVTPPQAVAEVLGLKKGERAQASTRVRYLDDRPMSYLVTHVPESIGITYSEGDLATRPLLELLERSGVVATRADQTISATLAGPETAEALAVEVGSPLISLTRVVRGVNGAGVEHLAALYRPDMHAFHMQMLRIGDDANRSWRPMSGSIHQSAPGQMLGTVNTTPTPRKAASQPERRAATSARRRS